MRVLDENNIPNYWSVKELKDLRDKTDNYSYTGGPFGSDLKSEHYTESGVRIIQLQNIGDGKYLNEHKIFTSNEKANELLNCNIYSGDIIIAKMAEPLARACIIPDESDRFLMASDGIRLKVDERLYNTKYIMEYINFEKFRREAIKKGTGSTRLRIGLQTLGSIKVIIPTLKEQEKIAEILSTWDLAIDTQEQLIEKKKGFKKGLMQKLLSGEVRFKQFEDKWNNKALENYIIPVSRECDKPNEGYWRLGLRSHGKGTFHEFVEDPSTVSMDKLYKVKCNDLIVNITFAWEHAIAVANDIDNDKLVSHRFPTYEFKENAYPLFFKYYILQPKFKNMLVNISPGGAGRNRVMSKKDFLKLEVKVPSYDEQVKIAQVLKIADKEIELLEKELEALKLQKKGLMQRLLTGEVRVKV